MLFFVAGCLDPEPESWDRTVTFIPAIYGYDDEISNSLLITSEGPFVAPDLNRRNINKGQALLANFSIMSEYQTLENHILIVAVNVTYVEKVKPQPEFDETAEENDFIPIYDVDLRDEIIYDEDSVVIFFLFNHDYEEILTISYEMSYGIDEIDGIPTLYIRAKRSSSETPVFEFMSVCAFEMTDFFKTPEISEEKKFKVMFKTGEENGVEIYKQWERNHYEPWFFR